MCHPLAGGKGGTQYQRGGKRFEERGLRVQTADYQTSDIRLQTNMVPGNVSSHIRLVTWRREISRLCGDSA